MAVISRSRASQPSPDGPVFTPLVLGQYRTKETAKTGGHPTCGEDDLGLGFVGEESCRILVIVTA